ncbi:MAG: class I SAM-dependent methyltransferase [Lentisphaerae bacterium]|nr:class I SAM-dependent methyltransferase [Lentisphaerota bacterium]
MDSFVATADANQNAVDIFKGEWASALPESLNVRAGTVPLFADARIQWLNQRLPVAGLTVLELGPLEGGHTWQLEQLGAASILALEANTRAFLKCLIVKELLDLKRARFRCVDFMAYLEGSPEPVDLCLASGVLYHLRRPVAFLERVSRVAGSLFLWTHYYDEAVIRGNRQIAFRFAPGVRAEQSGFAHTLYRRNYGAGLFARRSFGGGESFSSWLSRDDILGALRHFGLTEIEVNFEQPDHPHGPCFALLAQRRAAPS